MNLSKDNLLVKTISRGGWDHLVEMTHLPTGLTASFSGLQRETSLETLKTKARRALERSVAARLASIKDQPHET